MSIEADLIHPLPGTSSLWPPIVNDTVVRLKHNRLQAYAFIRMSFSRAFRNNSPSFCIWPDLHECVLFLILHASLHFCDISFVGDNNFGEQQMNRATTWLCVTAKRKDRSKAKESYTYVIVSLTNIWHVWTGHVLFSLSSCVPFLLVLFLTPSSHWNPPTLFLLVLLSLALLHLRFSFFSYVVNFCLSIRVPLTSFLRSFCF